MSDRLDESLARAAVMDRDGYPYIIHPLTDGIPRLHPGLLLDWTDWAAGQSLLAGATLLVAPEAMAIPLATALSLRTGIPFVVVRKRQYHTQGETVAYCETGYSQNCLYVNDVHPGDRVVLIDDVVSTGGTLDALISTLQGIGATVQGALVFLEKGHKADEVAARAEVPIQVMRHVHVHDGTVRIDDHGATTAATPTGDGPDTKP